MFFALSLIVKRELLILFLLVFSLSAWGKESPSITLVQQKAIEYADLKPQQVTRWRKKLRQSAWHAAKSKTVIGHTSKTNNYFRKNHMSTEISKMKAFTKIKYGGPEILCLEEV